MTRNRYNLVALWILRLQHPLCIKERVAHLISFAFILFSLRVKRTLGACHISTKIHVPLCSPFLRQCVVMEDGVWRTWVDHFYLFCLLILALARWEGFPQTFVCRRAIWAVLTSIFLDLALSDGFFLEMPRMKMPWLLEIWGTLLV